MTDVEIRVLDDPAEAAGSSWRRQLSPARIWRSRADRRSGGRTRSPLGSRGRGATCTSGSATSGRCRPTTSARTTGSSASRCSTRLESPPVVHRIQGEQPAEAAAALYDGELAGVVLDLALNGIGSDGHTASLFPGAESLEETERRAVAAEAGLEPFVPRVTLTLPVFAACDLLVYLVTGEGKAEASRRAFAAEPGAATPASLVRGRRTIALLDPAAASLLDG